MNTVIQLTQQLLDEHGLTDKGWTVVTHNRKTALGTCSHRNKTIAFSTFFTPHVTEESAWDTITHEVAHALVKPHRNPLTGKRVVHGDDWRRMHIKLGGSGERTSNDSDFINGISPSKLEVKQPKYTAVCPSCGHVSNRNRRPTREYACATCCKGRFNRNFLFVYEQNY